MDRNEVQAIYNSELAEVYDAKYIDSPWCRHGADFELEVLRELLVHGGPWLDLCCGTGYFLSQFPTVPRTGLDISPAMLAKARLANPGVEFIERDAGEPVNEWKGRWPLASCMWTAYTYFESMRAIEAFVATMSEYVAPGGALFLSSVIDLEDLRPHTVIDYEAYPEVFGGRIAVTGYYWTWEESDGTLQKNMLVPHADHFVRLLEPFFHRIEVRRYPVFQAGYVARKAIVATDRRAAGQVGDAEITWETRPRPAEELSAGGSAAPNDVEVLRQQLASARSEIERLTRRS